MAHQPFRHGALLYRGTDGLLPAVVPFVRDGLNRDNPSRTEDDRLAAPRLESGRKRRRRVLRARMGAMRETMPAP